MAKKKNKSPSMAVVMEDDWEAQDALRTLTRADEIKGNKKLMSKVKKEAVKQEKVLKKVINNPHKPKKKAVPKNPPKKKMNPKKKNY